ncbi:RNA 2',3'-cyclic phosphodiesterase [Paenibacillus phocaensis]|uniref:RNA 2',3'-cyclic phosphodiesterase n=1 Tax=Paenibacillus phocaensis TaxID=1776378 RepID=UPI000839BF3A|nr:RNA 2',3'-cyclic phosphodiesterase [Paenibacillus phocaensis]
MSGNEEKWRLFIAVPLPQEIKQKLDAWCKEQTARLQFKKWVHAGDYHITVQFLGDTSPGRLDDLTASIEQAAKGAAPLSLEAAGIGTFGRPASPSVLWAGVRGEVAGLERLHGRVTSENRALGFVPEERRFSPHITLARKYREGARLDPQALQVLPEFGTWTADRLVIYRTHMHERPMYEVVGTALLS